MTTPNSPSWSTRCEMRGRRTVAPGANSADGGLRKMSGSTGTSLPQFGGVFAVVAADADNFGRPHRRQQGRFRQRDGRNALAGEAFQVSIRFFGRGEQLAGDPVTLYQAVVGLTIELEAAVNHN